MPSYACFGIINKMYLITGTVQILNKQTKITSAIYLLSAGAIKLVTADIPKNADAIKNGIS